MPARLSGNTALVTGGAGFIGSHLVGSLISSGWDVRVLDDLSTGKLDNLNESFGSRRFSFIRGSIRKIEVVRRVIRGADVVFHLAAIVSVPRSIRETHLVHDTNVNGTLLLLEEARKADVGRFVFASSAAVYGDSYTPPLTEDLPPRPTSPYGAGKAASEEYCQAYYRSFSLKTTVLRYFNVYGPRSAGPYAGVMAQFAKDALEGRPFTVFGDGKQTRDFVNVADVVSATIKAAQSPEAAGEILNIGTGLPVTLLDLVRLFSAASHTQSLRVKHSSPRPGDIRLSWASIARARALIGYSPKVSLEEGIASLMKQG